ncbi:MAG: DNA mismatch repair endonuclease MutL [Bacteroidota bacterium]
MSGIIKLLPNNIANQIKAGEVIQRPASVVKELMENAIDAGATHIQVFVKDAGRTLIQIIDNGKGMSADDAALCFERHATSKIANTADLQTLTTKGFRGEALASIGAIAHVTLQTRQSDSELGTKIELEGGKIISNEPCVCSIGTSFEIKNLFYNVPVRRNFLKSDSIEFTHLKEEFDRLGYVHHEIKFELKHNGTSIYHLEPQSLKQRIVAMLGSRVSDKLVPIQEESDIVLLSGFVGKPDFAKKSRGEQFLFVNDRFFKDSYFHHAITRAFEGLLPQKHIPSYFLYLKVNPAKIDVNVHPTKTEIKFEEDKFIYKIMLSAIKQSLGHYNIMPTLDFERESSFDVPLSMRNEPAFEPVIKVNQNFNPFDRETKERSFSQALQSKGFGAMTTNQEDWRNFYEIKTEDEADKTLDFEMEEEFVPTDVLLIDKFIYATVNEGIILIDYRLLVEKITYDSLMATFVLNPIASQQLLFPFEREMNAKDLAAWEDNKSLLDRFGFIWETKKSGLEITGIPSILQQENINDCIDSILENVAYKEIEKGEIAHEVIASLSNAASKFKKITSKEEALQLITQFNNLPEKLSPRDKALYSIISTQEIKARF